MSKLERIVDLRRKDVDEAKRSGASVEELLARGSAYRSANISLYDRLKGKSEMRLAAEFKRASPSKGDIRTSSGEEVDLGSQVAAYVAGGASVLSVLTEDRHFKGTLEDLKEARRVAVEASKDDPTNRCLLLRKTLLLTPISCTRR